MEDYIQHFEDLAAQADCLSSKQEAQIFVSGLKLHIAIDVRIHQPTDLSSAMHLARLYEQCAGALSQQPRRATTQTQHTLFVKRLNRAEMETKRAKGFCFNCDETFTPGHRCKRLFWLEGIEDAREEKGGEQEDEAGASINVIKGDINAKTMQVCGHILHSTVQILINSGSTHCFIGTALAKSVHLPVQSQKIRVAVANGGKLQCSGLSTDVQVRLGKTFSYWICSSFR